MLGLPALRRLRRRAQGIRGTVPAAWDTMNRHHRNARRLAALTRTAIACVALAASSGALAATASPAHRQPAIKAKPTNLMVDKSTTLTGSGWPRRAKITLRECASEAWAAPREPCLEEDLETVETNGSGRFSAAFEVGVCDGAFSGPTQRTCYIGEPEPSGVDTIELRGAVAIQVSYP